MEIKTQSANGQLIAIIESADVIIQDSQSALDLMSTVYYQTQCQGIAISKEAIIESFFDLKTGIAGDILQKFTNYQMKLAIIGDYAQYQSQALKDFIYESNQGRHIYFVADAATAVQKLSK